MTLIALILTVTLIAEVVWHNSWDGSKGGAR